VLSSTGVGIDDLRQKECRHAVIRFRDNPEHIIPESFPVPETVLSYPSARRRGWECCLMASFLVSGPSGTQQFVIYSKMLNHRRPFRFPQGMRQLIEQARQDNLFLGKS
jgi:hypothetical protein